MKKLRLEVNGEELEVLAQKMGGQLWVHCQGETFVYTPKSAQQSVGGAAAAQDPSQIVAPMPGKIIKVQKSVGDSVAEGETIVVMEAMKMEYNLKATQAMKITEILVKENQTVSLGEKLVGMKE